MANYNKRIEQLITKVYEKHLTEGHFPQVKFERYAGYMSCSLFDYATCEQPYDYAVHRYITDVLGDPHGIYTKKRSEAFLKQIEMVLDQPVLTVKDLQVGDRIKLSAILDISKQYREATIGQLDMLESDNIVDLIDCAEEHGYQDTYGSCYSNEILLIKRNGFWRRFEGVGKEALSISI